MKNNKKEEERKFSEGHGFSFKERALRWAIYESTDKDDLRWGLLLETFEL